MSDFYFAQRCRPQGKLRINDLIEFMRLLEEAFQVPGWVDPDEQTVELEPEWIEHALRSRVSSSELEKFGVTWVVKSRGDDAPILLKTAMGGDEWSLNFFTADFSRTSVFPDLRYFRESIELVRPYEAFIGDLDNEHELWEEQPQLPPGDRPRILRWLHYMDAELVAMVGGMTHCLKTPAFKVEPFCDGVLFQLTDVAFEPDNPQHKEIQRRAMNHLGLK